MKKVCLMAALLMMVIAFAACGGTAEPAPAVQTEVVQTEATSEPEPTPEPTPSLNDPMIMAGTVLNDPQVIFSEDAMAMEANGGSNFGDVAVKQLSADGSYYQFISNDDGAYMIGNLNFLDVGEFRGNAQAIMFKFQPENVEGLYFTLFGAGEIIMRFEDNQPYLVHVQDGYKAPYSDYQPTDLRLENDKWYWAMMAMDQNGYYRSMVWEDGNVANIAYCAENMGDWHDEYKGSNWHLTISFGANQTLNIQEYKVMDFDGYADMGTSTSDTVDNGGGDNMQSGDGFDYGPGWNINIADNFDIISDMVWQSVQRQDIEAGGSVYTGYNLAEMMNFSGNGSDKASVFFGQDGTNETIVQPTSDAYIVFMKDGEFLGGPFLLVGDQLSENMVTKVNPS